MTAAENPAIKRATKFDVDVTEATDPLLPANNGEPRRKYAGNQSTGWRRWRRAAEAAWDRPTSFNARMYFARVSAAETLAALIDRQGGSVARRRWECHRAVIRDGRLEMAWTWQACSTRCMALALQLETGATGLADLHAFDFAGRCVAVVPRPATSTHKTAPCAACGSKSWPAA